MQRFLVIANNRRAEDFSSCPEYFFQNVKNVSCTMSNAME